jgi:uncharacterized protein
MTRESIIESIKNTLKRYGITKAYLFGSFARMDDDYHDIDVAIEPPQGKFSLFDLVGVEQELEDLTGQKVDVVIYRALKPRIKNYVDQDLVPIL